MCGAMNIWEICGLSPNFAVNLILLLKHKALLKKLFLHSNMNTGGTD